MYGSWNLGGIVCWKIFGSVEVNMKEELSLLSGTTLSLSLTPLSAQRVAHNTLGMLPAGWSTRESKSRGIPYYINDYTKEAVWEKPTEAAVKPMADQVQASHILRKHSGSRRPSSWRCDVISQSKETSISQIQQFREELMLCLQNEGPEAMQTKFASIARTESDCGSAQKGGDLGLFGRGQMQKAFEDATYALKVGEISDIVDSDSGIHIILRVR